jgi:hypothetical protein
VRGNGHGLAARSAKASAPKRALRDAIQQEHEQEAHTLPRGVAQLEDADFHDM